MDDNSVRDEQEESELEPEQEEQTQVEEAEEQVEQGATEQADEPKHDAQAQPRIGYYNSIEEAERGIQEKDRTIRQWSEENRTKDAEIARLKSELAKNGQAQHGQNDADKTMQRQQSKAPDPNEDFDAYVRWLGETITTQANEISALRSNIETKAREVVTQYEQNREQQGAMQKAEEEFDLVISSNPYLYLRADAHIIDAAAKNQSDPAHERAVRTMELARLVTQNRLTSEEAHSLIELRAKKTTQASKQKQQQATTQTVVPQARQTIVRRDIPQDKSQTVEIKTLDQALSAMRASVQ